MKAISLKSGSQPQRGARLIAVLLLGLLMLCASGCTCNARKATPTPTATVPPATPMPSPTASPTPSPSPSLTPSATPTPTLAPTATPIAGAVVLTDGATLRPGATTWWFPRHTLTTGTTLTVAGYDPDFPTWIYVRRMSDAAIEGWIEIQNLELYRDLEDVPHITPIPTLTPTPETAAATAPATAPATAAATEGTPSSTLPPSAPPTISAPPEGCEGGALTLEAWHAEKFYVEDGWVVRVCGEAHGGNCMYTYFWENEIRGGPMTGPICFEVQVGTYAETVVGTISVSSGEQTARRSLYITRPRR